MTRLQLGIVGMAVTLFLVLYFVFDTKPPEQKEIEKSRSLTSELTDIAALLKEAKDTLPPPMRSTVMAFEERVKGAPSDSAKVKVFEEMAGLWYDLGRPDLSGYYAMQIAESVQSEEAWSIAGTTFTICLQTQSNPKVLDYCSNRATASFESAISLNPDNINNRVNLALSYTEYPPKDNPMQGILMLVELNKKYPENILVLENLGRLAIQTGQYEKAKERLEKAYSLNPDNLKVICLLAQTYESLGASEKAADFTTRCQAGK